MKTTGEYQAWKSELILIFLFMEDLKSDVLQKQKRETMQHPWKLEKARNFTEVKSLGKSKYIFQSLNPSVFYGRLDLVFMSIFYIGYSSNFAQEKLVVQQIKKEITSTLFHFNLFIFNAAFWAAHVFLPLTSHLFAWKEEWMIGRHQSNTHIAEHILYQLGTRLQPTTVSLVPYPANPAFPLNSPVKKRPTYESDALLIQMIHKETLLKQEMIYSKSLSSSRELPNI